MILGYFTVIFRHKRHDMKGRKPQWMANISKDTCKTIKFAARCRPQSYVRRPC